MNIKRTYIRVLSFFLVFLLSIPLQVFAQDSGGGEHARQFTREELAQMLAPIALYPDALLAQILMASTYPLEVVQAERWISQRKDLKGDQLDEALQDKTWDPSVKSLCHFPNVLTAMSDRLEQTEKLGDAFLGQEKDVMDTVQELRRKAREQGNLKTTNEQKVIVEKETVVIEPANPEIVYVPVYNPFLVYGPWWYPAYPPYYWYYPGSVVVSGTIGFGIGIALGIGIISWSLFDWHNHVIHVDLFRAVRFHRVHPGFEGRRIWRHEIEHRRGVAYRDRSTSLRFGQATEHRAESRREARGYLERRLEQRPGGIVRGFPERRRDIGSTRRIERSPEPDRRSDAHAAGRERTGRVESGAVQRPEGRDQANRGFVRGMTEREEVKRAVEGHGAFEGMDNGGNETKAGHRGFRSRRGTVNRESDRGSDGKGRFPGGIGPAPGAVGRAPGDVGRAPGDVGRAPGNVGRAPGDVGRVPRGQGRIREGGGFRR